jgi:hypothetical protein
VAGSLTSYGLLPAEGCTIGAYTVADVTAGVLLPGATAISPDDVLVTPISGVGLGFGLVTTAGPGELLDLLIRFTLTGPLLGSAELALFGSTATGDGNATAVQDACVGGTFADAEPTSPCSGTLASLIAVRDATQLVSPASGVFGPSSFFDVFLEITVDGGLGGGAALGTVTTQFGPREVPAPSALVLLTAAAAAGLCRRRRAARP